MPQLRPYTAEKINRIFKNIYTKVSGTWLQKKGRVKFLGTFKNFPSQKRLCFNLRKCVLYVERLLWHSEILGL